MGYCITASGQVRLRVEATSKALEAAKAIFSPPVMAANETFGDHYAWIDTDEALASKTLAEMLRVWRYNVTNEDGEPDEKGVLSWDIWFDGEKLGDEQYLFAAIAPFILDGDIEAQGEDGESWRWHFADGKCEEQMGRTVYE